jgi:hypothetical protein
MLVRDTVQPYLILEALGQNVQISDELTSALAWLFSTSNPYTIEVSAMSKLESPILSSATQEWLASGVDPGIMALNVEEVSGSGAIELILATQIAKLQKVTSYVTAEAARLIQRYSHLDQGGWWVSGLDPLNGWERMEWGQLKPSTPRLNDKGQPIKYESVLGEPARALFLDVPPAIARLIYAQAGVNPTPDDQALGVWHCIQQYRIPVVLVEGAKKAGAVLTAGFAAIALPGIWNGRRVEREAWGQIGNEFLIPDLEGFNDGRRITFCFDQDEKRKTRRAVASAIRATSRLFASAGCECVVARWQTAWGKGIDDMAVAKGLDAVRGILDAASPYNDQAALAKLHQPQPWEEQYAAAAQAAWMRSRQFSATEQTNQQFVQLDHATLQDYDIHALKSGMGSGKTKAIADLLAQWEGGAIAIGYRNSLLLQSCERWGKFYHLHQDSAFGLLADPNGRIAACIDSILHFADHHFDGKILILDEVVSVIKHSLTSSTLSSKRSQCLAKLEQAIRRAAVVICWDGNNCDLVINYVVTLRGQNCRVLKQLNEYRGEPLQVELVRSVDPETGTAQFRDYSPVVKKLDESLAALATVTDGSAKAVMVLADSQRLCESLDDRLTQGGYRVLRVDSKTLGTPPVKAFLTDPNLYLRQNETDLVILSPTAESGIDISIQNYFRKGFAFFFGVVDTQTQMQFLRRVRSLYDWTVWCAEYSTQQDGEGMRSPFVRRLTQQMTDYLQLELDLTLNGKERTELETQFFQGLRDELQDVHVQTALQVMAARNYERAHTRDCLITALEEAGHPVIQQDWAPEQDIQAACKEARERIIVADSNAIFSSRDISLAEALRIKSRFSAGVDDRFAAEKALLLNRLPGIESSAVWNPEFVATVLFRERSRLAQLERWWLLNHLETAKARSQHRWQQAIEQAQRFLPDLRSDYALLLALHRLNLVGFVGQGQYTAESEAVKALFRRCKSSKKMQIALGRSPGKLKPMDWLGRLMRLVGVSSRSTQPKYGEVGRVYQYEAPDLDALNAAVLACLDQKFQPHSDSAATPPVKADQGQHLSFDENPVKGQGDERLTGDSAKSDFEHWFTPESLADVRQMWESAQGNARMRSDLLREVPESVLRHLGLTG